MNMIRGEHMRGAAGLLFLQPYDPEKVPVIFVHGLLSTPSAWANVVSSLSSDPEIRRHFQFWGFAYSTGNPIVYSALLLRQDLVYAEETYHFKQAILVGHSMGGIISRLQVTNSGRTLWNGVLVRRQTLFIFRNQTIPRSNRRCFFLRIRSSNE
jgi:triacylglycerol esterase/lipase EstA (alpha/beta hydrolase family)